MAYSSDVLEQLEKEIIKKYGMSLDEYFDTKKESEESMENNTISEKPILDLPEIIVPTEEITEEIETLKKPQPISNLISEEEFLEMWKPMPLSLGKQKKLKR